jgi:uncharacterized protein (DUF1330 family)
MAQATVIVEGTFRAGHAAYFAEYSRTVRAYLEKHGGVVVRRQRVEKVLYGPRQPDATKPDLIMLIDFPDAAIAERIFFAPEYLAIIPLRDKVFADFRMYLGAYGEI